MHPLERFAYCPVCGSKHFEEQDDKSKRCSNCGFEYYLNPSSATAAFILNGEGQLLVLTRAKDPAKGMLDLPGGFCDIGETLEEGIAREVMEETSLEVKHVRYLFSYPNKYRYSDFDVPTVDSFFECEVDDVSGLAAHDDAKRAQWLSLDDIHTEQFGLRSIRQALRHYLDMRGIK